MPDVLIRGLSDATVARIDAEAASIGLSRNEHLRMRNCGWIVSTGARFGSAPSRGWRSATHFGARSRREASKPRHLSS